MKMSWDEYVEDRKRYTELNKNPEFAIASENEWPILSDKYSDNGVGAEDFFAYPIWTARKVKENAPDEHWDVGSLIDTVIANLLTFRENLVLVTNRWIPQNFLHQLKCRAYSSRDLTSELSKVESSSVESLSCCNYLEHIGLGRYGETICADAWIELLNQIKRVLRAKGKFYLTTRIAEEEQLVFNRYRDFSYQTILKYCEPLQLEEMSITIGKNMGQCMYRDSERKGELIINQELLEEMNKTHRAHICMFEFTKGEDV